MRVPLNLTLVAQPWISHAVLTAILDLFVFTYMFFHTVKSHLYCNILCVCMYVSGSEWYAWNIKSISDGCIYYYYIFLDRFFKLVITLISYMYQSHSLIFCSVISSVYISITGCLTQTKKMFACRTLLILLCSYTALI